MTYGHTRRSVWEEIRQREAPSVRSDSLFNTARYLANGAKYDIGYSIND